MRILSIEATNYRTLADIKLQFAKNYCTISGKNNAGKSCVIRLLSTLFRSSRTYPWVVDDFRFDYKEDKTQWVKSSDPIKIDYLLELTRSEDPALISFIETHAKRRLETPTLSYLVTYTVSDSYDVLISAKIDGAAIEDKAAKEIDKRIKDSNLLFLYNSTTQHEDYYYGRGRRRMFYEFVMSEDEKKQIDEASKKVERKLRKLAKQHKQGLSGILGRLSEKYDVEFTAPEGFAARHMPLGINLKDKNVEVPLNDWGSGTQNRTHIMMAILQANRIKTTESPDDKITPFVVIEEPESFLHPSAQSEFGRILRKLSSDFGIQIIVTTHSPHMLNQEDPSSNILLCRELKHKKAFQTRVVDTSAEKWMAPFSEHLGLDSDEFSALKPIFSSYRSKVLLVEGVIDKSYFDFFKKSPFLDQKLNSEIEVVSYGGKDTLKNTLLIKFVLSKFDQVFITYDLDADSDVRTCLSRLELKEKRDFLPLGVTLAGKECIEGLLPTQVLSAVYEKEPDLVMKLTSKDNKDKRTAKDELKQKYLEEFIRNQSYKKDEIREIEKVIKIINSKFSN
jgi:putative ATP-dependent endonuclease of the OLD family